jgi:C-terminal processing protease CtpA/Prc
MKQVFLFIFFSILLGKGHSQQITTERFRQDFDYFWNTINTDYCYWDKKKTNWQRVKTIYEKSVDTITGRKSFVELLEKMFYELYDHHASLNTNTAESQRLVPSGADVWAEYINSKPVIVETRRGFNAERSGIKPGMEVFAFNDTPIEKAIQPFLPKSVTINVNEAKNYALRMLLAGKHSERRKITVIYKNRKIDFYPDQSGNIDDYKYESSIESRLLENNVGYIRINNCLWDNSLITVFDSVLNRFMETKALILDLRETPSGGNTTVARAIIGRFIRQEGFYQKHELPAEQRTTGVKRSWVEIVSPRKKVYSKPLILLVNHWTGSVGEGIVVGFDAFKRATIIGTKMAALNGAVYSYQMPNTKIGFNFPVEKLYHTNGFPRELFTPNILVDLTNQKDNEDKMLESAMGYLNKK